MKELKRFPISLPAPTLGGKRGAILRPGDALSLSLDIPAAPYPVRRRLRVVGEVDVFWRWRCEMAMPYLYHSIADALDSDHARGEKYCLHLQGHGESWPRNAFRSIEVTDDMRARELILAVMAEGRDLSLADSGELVVELGLYRSGDGYHNGMFIHPPDSVYRIDLPRGSFAMREFSLPVVLPANAAELLIRIGGQSFSGEAWIGTPRLYHQDGDTLIPPLMPDNPLERLRAWNWVGENLTRLEWPEFSIAIDDTTIFEGPVFNSIYRKTDFEIPLPALEVGNHQAQVTLLGDYATALPFVVMAAEVLQESTRPYEVIGYQEYVVEDRAFPVLIEKNDAAGSQLDVVEIAAGEARANPVYAMTLGDEIFAITPTRVVRREEDGLLLSTGDAIYIPQEMEAMRRYLAWYVEQQLGNAICFRPVYRWNGTREVNPEVWRHFVPLLERLQLKYYLLVDGRELPGAGANPPDALLAGTNYLGRQAHETDGTFNYRGSSEGDPLYTDLFLRRTKPDGPFPEVMTYWNQGLNVTFNDRYYATDMHEAAEYLVESLKLGKGPHTRHTGPAAIFHYFYLAGYDWLGAETMYGPEEVLLSSLRGASRAINKTDFGAHLAMQWSSAPQDTQAHAERYFLSLATCYLQGVTQINLEEGLWRMESEYAEHDRFSHACDIHRQAHARFRRFLL